MEDEEVTSFISKGAGVGRVSKPLGSKSTTRSTTQFIAIISFGLLSFILMIRAFLIFLEHDETSANMTLLRSYVADYRWEPLLVDEEEDSCLTRLANATIHCGVGGLIPLTNTTSESGEKQYYCGGVKMKPNYCILPKRGSWKLPDYPSPLPKRFGIQSAKMNNSTLLPRCLTMEGFLNGTWKGIGFSEQEFVPSSCSVIPLSPYTWTEHTNCQATIILFGDSHIRNLFTATVYGLRGIESFAEGHAGNATKARGIAISYEWRLHQNGSAIDHITVHSNVKSRDPELFDNCNCDKEVKKCLRIAFFWAPTFQEQLNYSHYIKKWETDLVIVEPGNSYEPILALSTEWASRFDSLLLEDKTLHLGLLHFPYGNQPTNRKDVLTSWTNNGTFANRKSYLSQSAMEPPVGGKQGLKTFHYTCGLGKLDVTNDNINAAEPCTDLIDTVDIRALITVHYDALSK